MLLGAVSRESATLSSACVQTLSKIAGDQLTIVRQKNFVVAAPRTVETSQYVAAVSGEPHLPGGHRPSPQEIVELIKDKNHAELSQLSGGFSLFVHFLDSQATCLAIDTIGIESISWIDTNEQVSFASTTRAALALSDQTPEIRAQALYDYFFFHMVPAPGSIFKGVKKLNPATLLNLDEAKLTPSIYWQPNLSLRGNSTRAALNEGLHQALRDAVAAARPDSHTGAFLSGGLDSSSVVGFLAEQAETARTFSMGFGEPGYDELEYARITAEHFSSQGNERVVTPSDVLRALPVVAENYDEPFGNSSAIPTYLCARFAKENGIDVLLAGDGGDELFAGNERYGRHQVFNVFGKLPKLVSAPITQLAQLFDAEHSALPLRKFRSYVDQASIPLPDRFESWNFVFREGSKIMFEEGFTDSINPSGPFLQMQNVFAEMPGDTLDKMLFYDWKYTLADNDLRKVSTMCSVAGVEVRYPMLDRGVIDLSVSVPSSMKMPRLKLRDFYKRAMQGFLDERTLNKEKHGFGLPFGVWLKSNKPLADFVYQALRDISTRGFIRADFVERLIREHKEGHAGYYGYVIWDLVILERWLQTHQPAYQFR